MLWGTVSAGHQHLTSSIPWALCVSDAGFSLFPVARVQRGDGKQTPLGVVGPPVVGQLVQGKSPCLFQSSYWEVVLRFLGFLHIFSQFHDQTFVCAPSSCLPSSPPRPPRLLPPLVCQVNAEVNALFLF